MIIYIFCKTMLFSSKRDQSELRLLVVIRTGLILGKKGFLFLLVLFLSGLLQDGHGDVPVTAPDGRGVDGVSGRQSGLAHRVVEAVGGADEGARPVEEQTRQRVLAQVLQHRLVLRLDQVQVRLVVVRERELARNVQTGLLERVLADLHLSIGFVHN